MSEKLISGFGSGKEIESNSSSRILQDYIKNSWSSVDVLATDIDFGASPDRTNKAITLLVTRTIDHVTTKDIGSHMFGYEVPMSVDVWVRDTSAQAQRREPTRLVQIDTYLRDFISTNQIGLRSKGINYMEHEGSMIVPDQPSDEKDTGWYHLVVGVRLYYTMNRVPV